MTKILISGVPGAGKTTVSEHMAQHLGFRHVDMEADSFKARVALERDAKGFLAELSDTEHVVISWGFSPYLDRPGVDAIIAGGYEFVWLDGDHVLTLRIFLKRIKNDPHQEANYYGQMGMILSTELVDRLKPICIDPFKHGEHRPVQEIATEIVKRVS